MQRDRLVVYAAVVALILIAVSLYSVPNLSELTFVEKTSVLMTFSIAVFAAVEGYATFKRAEMESTRHKIEDARNELEKAYGPLYTLLNNRASADEKKGGFWLEFEDRKKLDEIMATYPFMFSDAANNLWQEKIRNLASNLVVSDLKSAGYNNNLKVYLELRDLINEEYARKTKNYRELLEK